MATNSEKQRVDFSLSKKIAVIKRGCLLRSTLSAPYRCQVANFYPHFLLAYSTRPCTVVVTPQTARWQGLPFGRYLEKTVFSYSFGDNRRSSFIFRYKWKFLFLLYARKDEESKYVVENDIALRVAELLASKSRNFKF